MLAALLPLAIATAAVYLLGNKYYRQNAGQVFESRAQQMANFLVLSVDGQAESLHDRIALSDFYTLVEEINQERRKRSLEDVRAEIREMGRRWPELDPDSPEVRAILEGELAQAVQNYQELSPLFAEILVTDDVGRLVAATNKSTNYWHAFKPWWQIGMQQPFNKVFVEGVNFDESSGVYSIDVLFPIRDWTNPEAPPAGVIKGVINAAPLFFDLAQTVSETADWKIVLEDGTVLFGPAPAGERLPERTREPLLRYKSGWMLRKLEGTETRMIGFDRLPWLSHLPVRGNGLSTEPKPSPPLFPKIDAFVRALGEPEHWDPTQWEPAQRIYVLVHRDAAMVLAPIRAQLLLIIGSGVLLVLACFFIGVYLAQHHIIRPINLLQAAAKNIAALAKLERVRDASRALPEVPLNSRTQKLLKRLANLKSNDELGELAQNFNAMAHRVLSYHAHLEADIQAKVAEIQGDLVIAREFQEALMPHDYPAVPESPTEETLRLEFKHIYKPASTVGGDFFNVIKLPGDRAGIFIADVMGHGSRSALVTAIVAALLHDLAPKAADPAQFMAALNRHFHHLIQHSKQLIFVTAFYIIIDIRERRALFASAGHPSPLLVQRRKGLVKPLIHSMQNDTALGLLEDSTYACFSRPVTEDDLFLLFTDGLFEAINPHGEEFGMERLTEVVTENMKFNPTQLGLKIIETVNRHSGFAAQSDDMCLVTVEVTAPVGASEDTEPAPLRKDQF